MEDFFKDGIGPSHWNPLKMWYISENSSKGPDYRVVRADTLEKLINVYNKHLEELFE